MRAHRNFISSYARGRRDGSKCLSDPSALADEFAEYFSSWSLQSAPEGSPVVAQGDDDFQCTLVDESEVMSAIKRLKPKRTVGADGDPVFIVRGCVDMLCCV